MFTIWDYECNECAFTEERLVKNEEKDSQVCPECDETLKRLLCTPALHTIAENSIEHQERMKKRSADHTERTKKQGNDLGANETQRNTCAEWKGKTRSKNTRRGMVRENMNLHKKFENVPAVQHIPSTHVTPLKSK